MANVRLPQIDLRQPELHNTSNHPRPGIAPAITEPKVLQLNSSAEKSNEHVDLDLTELNTTQAVACKYIKVKLPRFTYKDPAEQGHGPDTPAALFTSNHNRPGRTGALPRSKHFSARPLRDGDPKGKRSVLMNNSEPKRNVSKLNSSSSEQQIGARRAEFLTAPAAATQGSRGQGKQGKQGKQGRKASRAIGRSSMKVHEGARARYQGPANESGRTHGASTTRAPMTSASPPTTQRPSTTTDSLHLASSPKVTAHHARHNSSPRQWTDYANHTSNRSQQESPIRSAPRRSRGGTMSRRAFSSFPVPRGTIQRQSTGPVARLFDQWNTWVEIHVILFGLSPTISTGNLWSSFHDEGDITSIEIFEDSSGHRTGKAKIKFR